MIPLQKIATEVRIELLGMTKRAETGFIGGCLSVVEILTALYFGTAEGQALLQINPEKPRSEDQDIVILSKAHAAAALYCILAKAGFFPHEELLYFNQLGSTLKIFPSPKVRGITAGSGAPGQGLSIGNGIALGLKLDDKKQRVYVIIGDGELQEGQIWEAVMSTAHYQLDNLCAIIDYNEMQREGHIKGIKNIDPIADKFLSCGWKTITIEDGHDFDQIIKAIQKSHKNPRQPTVIIAPTIKGKGISFTERKNSYHATILSDSEMQIALTDLQKNLAFQESQLL